MITAQPPPPMSSNKPYFLRAIHEWIIANNCTPHLVVLTTYPGVMIPEYLRKDALVVLNLSMHAVVHFTIGNEAITFQARFKGVEHRIAIPIEAVTALYAMENHHGITLQATLPDAAAEQVAPPASDDSPTAPRRPSFLKLVK